MSASRRAANPRAVVDTNLFVSGLLWPNTLPGRLLAAWLDQQFRLVSAAPLRAEVAAVLARPKFARYHPNQRRLAATLEALAIVEQATMTAPLPLQCRDPKDEMLLACTLGGQVEYLVTGDEDLLVLAGHHALGSLRIVTPREFLTVLGMEPKA